MFNCPEFISGFINVHKEHLYLWKKAKGKVHPMTGLEGPGGGASRGIAIPIL